MTLHSSCNNYTTHSHSHTHNYKWTKHALERRQERDITIDPSHVNINDVVKLPYTIENGCYKYCDSKNGITYYIRNQEIVTIIKRNPIAMARRICQIKSIDFKSICRDHLFGNCKRGKECRFIHYNFKNE